MAVLPLLAGQAVAPQAKADTVWQIGVFDQSSSEFSGHVDQQTGQPRIDYVDPAQDPLFMVGRSNPAQDWLPFQPGSINGRAGYRRHPFTIKFNLPEQPVGIYTLRLALLAYSPRLPWLEIEINGHRAWFYQQPKLTYSAGDQWVFYLPYYSTSTIDCELPTRYLTKGINRLILTALDESGPRDDAQPSGFPWPGTSGIVYDALALDRSVPAKPTAPGMTARVSPTIYYKRRDGQLAELVDVFVRFNSRPRNGRVDVILGEQRLTARLEADRDFGEERVQFEVGEADLGRQGELAITTESGQQRMPVAITPAKRWTLFLAPNVHLDVGYSDYVSKVAEIHNRTVDEIIAMIGQNPEFRFNLDGSWIVEQFMRGRSEQQQKRFLQLARDRKILIPAVYASDFTGFQTIESLIRSLYFSKDFAREHNLEFDFSLANDVPSYSWSYASVMAAAGVRYFVAASDAYRAPFLLYNRFNEMSPQWWEGPDGGRVLTWYSRHYHHMASMFGLPPQIGAGRDALPRFLQMYDRPGYRSDAVLLFGTQVENTDLTSEQARLAEEWNGLYAYPKLQYAGFPEALSYIAKQMGDSIPVVRGDGGPYWEDGMVADAALTAVTRENEQRVLSAEKFSTISSLVNPLVRPDRVVLEDAWRNMLLTDEHSWQADRSVTDPESQQSIRQGEVKDARGREAKRQIDFTLGRALAAIADYIDSPKGTLVVFNPVTWKRSDLVEVDIDSGAALVDLTTNGEVPVELLSSGRSYRHVRFLAEDVPPLGYKCYLLKPASPLVRNGSGTTGGDAPTGALESPFYRVVLDPGTGAVRSIFDKELKRELVDVSSAFRFNQYLYVTGADDLPNRLVQYSTVSPMPKLQIHPAGGGRLVSVKKAPFGTIARLQSSSVNAPEIDTEILLFDAQKRIEFTNRIRKVKVYTKEAAYFAFPLAMDAPVFRYETQNGYINPARDLLPGAGMEWFNVQHWVTVQQAGVTAAIVPVDAPMITLGDIARGTWPSGFESRKGTVFSYIMSNYTPEGYPAGQGGEFTFRYVVSSAEKFDPVQLGRLGWAAMSPLEVNEIRPQDKTEFVRRPLPATEAPFLDIDAPNVTLVTWKAAEDGRGSILRFLEIAGKGGVVNVKVPNAKIGSVWQCNAVEDNQQRLEAGSSGFHFAAKPFEVVTVRLEVDGYRR